MAPFQLACFSGVADGRPEPCGVVHSQDRRTILFIIMVAGVALVQERRDPMLVVPRVTRGNWGKLWKFLASSSGSSK